MAQNHPKTVEQEIREPTAQPSDNKKTSPLPKRITEWVELDDTGGGAISDVHTGQCTV